MSELLRFKTRQAFRDWLLENCTSSEGVWLEFGKTKEVETLSAKDALLEALCFGWIDGVMKKLDDTSYKKYFAQRRQSPVHFRELVFTFPDGSLPFLESIHQHLALFLGQFGISRPSVTQKPEGFFYFTARRTDNDHIFS